MSRDVATVVGRWRPYANTPHGTRDTLHASRAERITPASKPMPPAVLARNGRRIGASTISAETVESAISARWEFWVPRDGIRSMLKTVAPAIAPIVLAA